MKQLQRGGAVVKLQVAEFETVLSKEKKKNSESYRDVSEVVGVTEVTSKECLGPRVPAGMGCYDHLWA